MQNGGLPAVLGFLKETDNPGCQAAAAGVVQQVCQDGKALGAMLASGAPQTHCFTLIGVAAGQCKPYICRKSIYYPHI